MLAAYHLAKDALPEVSNKFSRQDFTRPQLFACLVLKEFEKEDYRGIEQFLWDCPDLRRAIGLTKAPDHTTWHRASGAILAMRVAVGTALSGGPTHRSVRAAIPHTALILGASRRIARSGKDAGFEISATSEQPAVRIGPSSCDAVDFAAARRAASAAFFSEETFKDMLPSSDGSNRRGMGIVWLNWQKYGFGSRAFGHNAGNSSMLAVDPAHDLVVVIVSGGGRKDFAGRADAFYHGIINALQ